MEYAIRRVAEGSFEQVLETLERSIHAHGFVVAGSHDVRATLEHKGFSIRPIRIYEVRYPRPETADEHLTPGLMMPGRISVFEENGHVIVAALQAGIASDIFPDSGLETALADLGERIAAIVNDVAGAPGGQESDSAGTT